MAFDVIVKRHPKSYTIELHRLFIITDARAKGAYKNERYKHNNILVYEQFHTCRNFNRITNARTASRQKLSFKNSMLLENWLQRARGRMS